MADSWSRCWLSLSLRAYEQKQLTRSWAWCLPAWTCGQLWPRKPFCSEPDRGEEELTLCCPTKSHKHTHDWLWACSSEGSA